MSGTLATGGMGNSVAQYNLGLMYDNGRGVSEKDQEAANWYRMAAEQGNVRAQRNLGAKHAVGDKVPQDGLKALKWFRLAGKRGDAMAHYNLRKYVAYPPLSFASALALPATKSAWRASKRPKPVQISLSVHRSAGQRGAQRL